MKYFSAFSGIGGFELGIGDRGGCIGYSEVDKYAIQIYEKHFNHKNYGDITKIRAEELPDFDLFVGGFPCQSFSIAGKRGGFLDTRGTLFFEIARIVKEKRPRLLLLENVKGLLSHDGGNTFYIIITALDELGYDLQWQVLNSKNFGVPQNRERVFIIGHLRGTARPEVFPIRESDTVSGAQAEGKQENGTGIRGEVSSTIDARYGALRNSGETYMIHNVYGGFKEWMRKFKDYSPTLRTPRGGGHLPMVAEIVEQLKEEGLEPTEKGWESLDNLEKMRIRKLTPVECERLQGFPDGWTEMGMKERWNIGQDEARHFVEISDTQRYKCLGNAVTVNVIKEIAKKLL